MGVHINFYETATLTDEHKPHQESCYDDGHVHAFVLDGFEHALEGLEVGRCYTTSGGEFDIDNSYGNYNRFREALCHAVNGVEPSDVWEEPDLWRDKPFFEQIHFAD